MKTDIIEEVAKILELSFISDVKGVKIDKIVFEKIKKSIPLYSLSEWEYFASYSLNQNVRFRSNDEVEKWLYKRMYNE